MRLSETIYMLTIVYPVKQSEREALKREDELEVVLSRGVFVVKGITFSNQDPPESLSDDSEA